MQHISHLSSFFLVDVCIFSDQTSLGNGRFLAGGVMGGVLIPLPTPPPCPAPATAVFRGCAVDTRGANNPPFQKHRPAMHNAGQCAVQRQRPGEGGPDTMPRTAPGQGGGGRPSAQRSGPAVHSSQTPAPTPGRGGWRCSAANGVWVAGVARGESEGSTAGHNLAAFSFLAWLFREFRVFFVFFCRQNETKTSGPMPPK